jgi:hypothetical protein
MENSMDTHAEGRKRAEGETERPTARVRDHLTVAGQLLAQHKQEEISGIYPMKRPGHWRVMIVSHLLNHVTLLDPLGNGFTQEEISNIMDEYRGYEFSIWKQCLQTDDWNCGVWVAWLASFWTKHVASGLEGSKPIDDVIQEGLSARGIKDTNIYIDRIAYNEETILEIRKGFQDIIYAPCHPPCLTEWLEKWNTHLRDVLAVSPVTNLRRAPSTHERAPSGPIDLTGDASDLLRTNQSTAAFGATLVVATSADIDLTREVNDMPEGGGGARALSLCM